MHDHLGNELQLVPPGSSPTPSTYKVFSNDSGKTFFSQSVAPTNDSKYLGAQSTLTQTFYFKANRNAPKLHFLITKAVVRSIDSGGIPAILFCTWVPQNATEKELADSCNGKLTRAELDFRIESHSLSGANLSFRSEGNVTLTGARGDWRVKISGGKSPHSLFVTGDFEQEHDVGDSDSLRTFPIRRSSMCRSRSCTRTTYSAWKSR